MNNDTFKNLLVQGNRMLVKPAPQKAKTSKGIHLPESSQMAHNRGEVVAMGDKCVNIKDTKPGDIVIYNSNSGAPVEIDGVVYHLMLDYEAWLTEK